MTTYPLWVRERAAELCNAEGREHVPHEITGPTIIHDSPFGRVICRLIQTHEKEPVDPDVLAVREVIASQRVSYAHEAEKYRSGAYDGSLFFVDALAAYRAGKDAR